MARSEASRPVKALRNFAQGNSCPRSEKGPAFDAGYVPIEEGYGNAREAGERALELDGNLAEASAAIGAIKTYHDWDWARAEASLRRALALELGNAEVVKNAAGLARTLGHLEDASALYRRAVELGPSERAVYPNAWTCCF